MGNTVASTLYLVKAWNSTPDELPSFWQRMRIQLFAAALGRSERSLDKRIAHGVLDDEDYDFLNGAQDLEKVRIGRILGDLELQASSKKSISAALAGHETNILFLCFKPAFIDSRWNLLKIIPIFISLCIEFPVSFFREAALELNIQSNRLRENYFPLWVLLKLVLIPVQVVTNIFAFLMHVINHPVDSFKNKISMILGAFLTTVAITVLGTGMFNLLAYAPEFAAAVSVIGVGTGLVALCLGIILYAASFLGQTLGLLEEIYEACTKEVPANVKPATTITASAAISASPSKTNTHNNNSHNTSSSLATTVWQKQPAAPTTVSAESLYNSGIEALKHQKQQQAKDYFTQAATLCQDDEQLKLAFETLVTQCDDAVVLLSWEDFFRNNTTANQSYTLDI